MSEMEKYLSSSKGTLQQLEINLYANNIGAEGASSLANGLKVQPQLKKLDLDLYFNNVTEVGTKALTDVIA